MASLCGGGPDSQGSGPRFSFPPASPALRSPSVTTLREPVHGDIELTRDELRLVDTAEFQRLRGIKQLGSDPFQSAKGGEEGGDLRKGGVVTCEIVEVKDGGLEVKIVGTDLNAFIKRSELARDRADQRPERFAVGEKVDARVTLFDRKARKISVSIKALEVAEEKEAIAQYGSADSGASLGDILGAALKAREKKGE